MDKLLKGRTVLITGGTGTIGREILRQALAFAPAAVRIYSRDESKQFDMQQEFAGCRNVRYLIGDIRDKERLTLAMEDVDLVFHTAALKHVRACEYNPFEAVKTNIEGTQNVIDAALANGVRKVIMTSSDEAVNPVNTLGVSKLMAEKLMTAANHYKGKRRTVFACVRYGHVLGSRGSVWLRVMEQLSLGGPVTLTHPDMTHFVMSLPEAVNLIFRAAQLASGGEVYILKMPVLRMADLLAVMVEDLAPILGRNPATVRVEIIGSQPGERLTDELISDEEKPRTVLRDGLYVVLPATRRQEPCDRPLQAVGASSCACLSEEDIRAYLGERNLL